MEAREGRPQQGAGHLPAPLLADVQRRGSDNLWSLFHSSKKPFFNLSYIKSPLYDKLVDTAGEQFGTDKKAAQATYEKAMYSLWGAAAGFFLYDVDAILVASKSVKTDGALNINYPFVQFVYAMHQVG